MSEPKKNLKFKCGACGQEGHNKRTCPTTKAERLLEPKPEVKQEPQVIYALEFADDNGNSVYRNTKLYASLDGLLKGIDNIIKEIQEDHDDSDDDEKPPGYAKELFYYAGSTNLKSIPTPTREYLESVLNAGPKRSHLNGLIIKIGPELGGAATFACEISIHKKMLNP